MLAHLAVLAAEGGETINPVVPDEIGEIVWGAIGFFGLWILMRYVCLPPLLRIRAQREQQIQADREAAGGGEKIGLKMKMSGRCMPPSNGSFRMNTSPGYTRPAKAALTAAIAVGIEPR